MEKKMTCNEIRRVYGIPPERLAVWLSKGFIQGTPAAVTLSSLESFLADIGYEENHIRYRSLTKVSAAFRQFVYTWPDMLGPELNKMLRECIEGDDINGVARKHNISLSTLQYYIRTASIRLRRYYDDVPGLRHRLAEVLQDNRKLQVLLKNKEGLADKNRDLIKDRVIVALKENYGYDDAELDSAYQNFMRLLHTSVAEMGLPVRCVNASVKSGVNTLFDFIVVNKACGKSGMLTKMTHFGVGSYQEVESLLSRLNLIRVDKNGNWQSAADFLIDTESELYIRYSGVRTVSGQRQRLKGNELVAEWIGNYMAFTHDQKRKRV